MTTEKSKTVIVLGAGPAGLAIGYELSRRGIDYVILEKGKVAGESFSRYPHNIFFGPWLNNTLPGSRVGWSWLLRRATQPAYTWYLGEYARRHNLPIDFNTEVHSVEHDSDGFRVSTSQGSYRSQLLVNCSGYFSTPNLPNYPGQEASSIVTMHSHQFRDYTDLQRKLGGRAGGKVLVVGAGLTAGETLMELYKNGYQVSLSHRDRLVFGPSPEMEALLSPFSWVVEQLSVAFGVRRNSNPPMAGGRVKQLIEAGTIPLYRGISRFEHDSIVFVDGRQASFDAVVWATGYHYTTRHLRGLLPEGPILLQGMESARVDGLYFLGLDQQRTYRSRFLRGIREDAEQLGQALARRLARQPLWEEVEEPMIDLDRCPALVTR